MPVATPGTPVLSRMSEENFGSPMCPGNCWLSPKHSLFCLPRCAAGKAPADPAISLSRFLTPASRVYSLMIF